MLLDYPYKIEINTKEEAVDYVKNQCSDCPHYKSNWECSSATLEKCIDAIMQIAHILNS